MLGYRVVLCAGLLMVAAGGALARETSVDVEGLKAGTVYECIANGNTCPTFNQGLPVMCGGGQGSTCWSCDDWQTQQGTCDSEIEGPCTPTVVECGEKRGGTCVVTKVGGAVRCKSLGGASWGPCADMASCQ